MRRRWTCDVGRWMGGVLGVGLLLLCANSAEAATYYVATNGNDANPGTQAQPFRTINTGVSRLGPSDTLFVRGGVYVEGVYQFTAGTSWTAPVTIKAYPGETPIIRPNAGDLYNPMYFEGAAQHHIVVDGFILDAINLVAPDFPWDTVMLSGSAAKSYPHHIRIQNCELKNSSSNGLYVGGDDNEFINLNIHDNGRVASWDISPVRLGVYVVGARNLIERCHIHRNGNRAIQIFNDWTGGQRVRDVLGNVIRHNLIHDNGLIDKGRTAVVLSTGAEGQKGGSAFYNNIVYNHPGGGVQVGWNGTVGNQVSHNTIYHNGEQHPDRANGGINIEESARDTVIQNNILYDNVGGDLVGTGTNLIASHNLTTDPKFINPSANDFHLLSSSPAIDAGVSLPDVPADFDGVSRPQGSGYDIGAYEFTAGGTLRGDLNQDGKRDLADVRLLIYMLIGQQAKTPEADLTGDGAVTLADVQALIRLMVGIP